MSMLITGATGSIGRHIIQQLLALGAPIRALSRKPGEANLPAEVEVFGGDLSSGEIQDGALLGVKQVFVFPADGNIQPFLEQAKQAGVEQLVVLSSLAAAGEHKRELQSASYLHHRAIEQAVEQSQIATTILRPGSFANNLRFWAYTIKTQQSVYAPYPQSAQNLIHEADIADVAVAALTNPGHLGKTYALTGPETLTQAEQLQTIGRAIGRELHFHTITPEQFRTSMSQFMPDDIISMLLAYWFDTIEQPDAVLLTVTQITGRPARTLAQWAADYRADFL